jgi:hypothetical protein
MESKWQRLVVVFAVAVSAIAVLVPLAAAQTQHSPGQVPSTLGSPDPREHILRSGYFAGLVATQLGSQDPRDTMFEQTASEHGSPGFGNYPKRLASPERGNTMFDRAAREHGSAGYGNYK